MMETNIQKTDSGYKIFLCIFYISSFIMTAIMLYGIFHMFTEWQEKNIYVLGEILVKTEIPFKNFAKLTTWLFFSSIISWYCVSRIGWKRTVKVDSWKMSLLQLMLLSFSVISLYEVLYNFTVLNSQITAGIINGEIPDIDSLVISYPDSNRPWNLIFATKMFLAAFLISSHAFYLSTRPRKNNVLQNL